MEFIDKVFIINLDIRKDRMNRMINLMNQIGIDNWERFPAIKPNFSSIEERHYRDYNKYQRLNKKYVKGSIGCKLSHLAVLKLAKQRNYKNVLILEDDVIFTGNRDLLRLGLREMEYMDPKIVYLGLNKPKYDNISDLVSLKYVRDGLCTHAYIAIQKHYDYLINLLENASKQIDLTYRDDFKENGGYYIIPNQFIQDNSFSNITNSFPRHSFK